MIKTTDTLYSLEKAEALVETLTEGETENDDDDILFIYRAKLAGSGPYYHVRAYESDGYLIGTF